MTHHPRIREELRETVRRVVAHFQAQGRIHDETKLVVDIEFADGAAVLALLRACQSHGQMGFVSHEAKRLYKTPNARVQPGDYRMRYVVTDGSLLAGAALSPADPGMTIDDSSKAKHNDFAVQLFLQNSAKHSKSWRFPLLFSSVPAGVSASKGKQ